jgi:hypothetical protein
MGRGFACVARPAWVARGAEVDGGVGCGRASPAGRASGPCCSGRSSGSCATGNVVETLLTCFHNNDCTVRRGPSPHGPSHDPQYQIMHACMHACHSVHPRTPPAAPPFTLSLAVSRYPWAHVFVCRCGLQDQT